MLPSRMFAAVCALSMASASGGACAMTQANSPDRCRVNGEELLPAEVGGPQALCGAIEAAADSRAPGIAFTVEIQVMSASSLSADVKLGDGTSLPKQKLSDSDRALNKSSVGRFASAIADAIVAARN